MLGGSFKGAFVFFSLELGSHLGFYGYFLIREKSKQVSFLFDFFLSRVRVDGHWIGHLNSHPFLNSEVLSLISNPFKDSRTSFHCKFWAPRCVPNSFRWNELCFFQSASLQLLSLPILTIDSFYFHSEFGLFDHLSPWLPKIIWRIKWIEITQLCWTQSSQFQRSNSQAHKSMSRCKFDNFFKNQFKMASFGRRWSR